MAITISTGMMRNHELPEGFKVAWVESDTEQVSYAEMVFNRYLNEGWIAFEDGKEKKQILRFDPKLTKIILLPPIGGG